MAPAELAGTDSEGGVGYFPPHAPFSLHDPVSPALPLRDGQGAIGIGMRRGRWETIHNFCASVNTDQIA
jgi:hypothetical protein